MLLFRQSLTSHCHIERASYQCHLDSRSRNPLGSPEEIHFPGTNFLVPTKRKMSSGKCDVSPIGDPRTTGCGMPATSAAIAFFAEDFW